MREVQSGRSTLAASVDAYDAEVFSRGKQEIETSVKAIHANHHFDLFMRSLLMQKGLHKMDTVSKDKTAAEKNDSPLEPALPPFKLS